MVKKDYYEILGVKKTDSAETIKKSYKKLALKFHPDKAGDDKKKEYEESFKEINEAYSTLGDEEKRKKYDSGATNPFSHGTTSHRGDFSEVLRDLFRNGSFGGNQFYDEEEEEEDSEVGADLSYELKIEFKEAVFGCEKEILIKKNVFCEYCDGTGAEDKEFESCYKCNGQGRLRVNQKTPWGVISQIIKCDNCDGKGQIPENKCSHCKGAGVINNREKIKIKIPKGVDDGQTLKVRNGGNAIRNGLEGDLFLLIRVKPDKIFKREGPNVYLDYPISFSQAALGDEIKIPTLSSEEITIKIKAGTESGSILRLKGKGIPLLNNPATFGDQFVKVIIKVPKKLSKAQITLLEELAKIDK